MTESENHAFDMERRLRELDPGLHGRFTDAVIALQYNLNHYQRLFPEFTDHTILHSMSVVDFCNQLIGDRLSRLNSGASDRPEDISSAGLRVLLMIYKALDGKKSFKLLNVNAEVKEILEVTGFDQFFL